jgi:hypothetical protein
VSLLLFSCKSYAKTNFSHYSWKTGANYKTATKTLLRPRRNRIYFIYRKQWGPKLKSFSLNAVQPPKVRER